MTVEPLRTVRNRLSDFVDRAEREHERVVVTRNGRPAAVLIGYDDLAALEETLEILSDPEAMADIPAAHNAGRGKRRQGDPARSHVPQNVRYAPKLGGAGVAYGSRPGRSSNGCASTSSSRLNGSRSPALAAASASSIWWFRGM